MKAWLFPIIIFTSLINFSCNKVCLEPTYPIEGLWIGTYSYTPGTPTTQIPQYFSFIIKPEGGLIVESGDAGRTFTATGAWTLNGKILNCRYTYPTSVPGTVLNQAATASFDNTGKLTNGIWFNTNSNWDKTSDANQQGTFIMQRVN